ncbi:MAG: exonuclease domain-containing protein [Beijerinckiaceae bacterium]
MRNNDTNSSGTSVDTQSSSALLNLSNLPQALGIPCGVDPDTLPESFIFYDVETTGLNPQFDQILQFAAIRTDKNFNIIDKLEDIIDIRCNILPWVVPSPGALVKIRVMPDDLTEQSLSFYQMMDRIQTVLERWQRPRPPLDAEGNPVDVPHIFSGGGPIFLGYNSLKFDEEFLRNALFQSLHAPYLTQSRLSSRADVLKMLQAVHGLAPGVVTIPEVFDERTGTNRISFKLGDVCMANGIDLNELQAHDALADVKATIALAKLIRERAPEVFQLMIDNCNKRNVLNSAMGNWCGIPGIDRSAKLDDAGSNATEMENRLMIPIAVCNVYGGKPVVQAVLPIGTLDGNGSALIALDLSFDPSDYMTLSNEDFARLAHLKPSPFIQIPVNRQPILLPLDLRQDHLPPVFDALAAPLAPDATDSRLQAQIILNSRMQRIFRQEMQKPGILRRILNAMEDKAKAWPVGEHEELQLYSGGFPSRGDDTLRHRMLAMEPSDFVRHIPAIMDRRLKTFAVRRAYHECPEALPESERQKLAGWVSERLLSEGEQPWRTLDGAFDEITQMREALQPEDQFTAGNPGSHDDEHHHLDQIEHWLRQVVRRAASAIN